MILQALCSLSSVPPVLVFSCFQFTCPVSFVFQFRLPEIRDRPQALNWNFEKKKKKETTRGRKHRWITLSITGRMVLADADSESPE